MWKERTGWWCVCGEGLYLVGLLNALDTAQGPHSQEHSLLGTGPGSLPLFLFNQQMNSESSLLLVLLDLGTHRGWYSCLSRLEFQKPAGAQVV